MTDNQNQSQSQPPPLFHRSDEELKKLFREVFVEEIRQIFLICQESTATFSETHKLEHDYIKVLIEREKLKSMFYRDITKQLVGWGLIATLGAIGAWVWSQVSLTK